MSMNKQEIIESLEKYFRENIILVKEAAIVDFVQLSEGWTDEAYLFNVTWEKNQEEQSKGFVLRKFKKGGLFSDIRNLFHQYKLLEALSTKSSLPVPKVYAYEEDESLLGSKFFVMEKLEGKSYVPWSKEGREFFRQAAENNPIPYQFVEHLADLHTLDYQSMNLGEWFTQVDEKHYLDIKIKELEELYANYKVFNDPVVADGLEWLKRNKPEPLPLSIIHNDYRTGNLLFENDRITGILDWEYAELGDPRMDLGYVCARANRMDSPLLCYLVNRDFFLEYYQQRTGFHFSPEDIYYFEVYHQVKFLLLSLSAGNSFFKEGSSDLRMARQGFRFTLMRKMTAELLGY
jgi:aminoglycoside phosphotransferase (APT) family kinase protein